MAKYKIIYTVPAEVVLSFEVEGNSQSEALIEGYDMLRRAKEKPASFKHAIEVVSLDTDAADARSVTRLPDAPAPAIDDNPPSPLALRNDFIVRYFAGENAQSQLVEAKENLHYDEARDMASKLSPVGPYGYVEIINGFTKARQFHNRAARGGWEVLTTAHNGDTTVARTWLADSAAAQREAISLLLSRQFMKVAVFDFNNRVIGPKLTRELQ